MARVLRRGRPSLPPSHESAQPALLRNPSSAVAGEDDSIKAGRAFFCDPARSPDGRYLVGASDGFVDEHGQRRRGACALKDTRSGLLCFKQSITRGNNPHVSNSGNVIVEDWKGQDLAGALISFDRGGKRLWARHFKANIFASDLSADGHRAFVSTCNSDHAPHSGKTFLLDASTGDTIWTRDGWGDVQFDGNALVAELDDGEGSKGRFPFDDLGNLPAAYHEAFRRSQGARERGQHWATLPKIQAALTGNKPDVALAKELLAELDGKEDQLPESIRARVLRFRGEVAEHEGDALAALELWRRALSIDPKVG